MPKPEKRVLLILEGLLMKQFTLIIIFCFLFVIGCESTTSRPSGQGYIFEICEGRVLILDNVNESDFGKGWKDIFEDYTGNAIWLNTTSKYKVGQEVRYWVGGDVNNSFPAEAGAKKIEIIKDKE
jgi:hypothetical protein